MSDSRANASAATRGRRFDASTPPSAHSLQLSLHGLANALLLCCGKELLHTSVGQVEQLTELATTLPSVRRPFDKVSTQVGEAIDFSNGSPPPQLYSSKLTNRLGRVIELRDERELDLGRRLPAPSRWLDEEVAICEFLTVVSAPAQHFGIGSGDLAVDLEPSAVSLDGASPVVEVLGNREIAGAWHRNAT
jgi:hypothetical protein